VPSRFATMQPWLSTVARPLLGGVFAVSGGAKIVDPDESIRAVRAYRILPEAGAQLMGLGLPVLELALAALLIVGLGTRLLAVASGVLMIVFISGVASVWARRRHPVPAGDPARHGAARRRRRSGPMAVQPAVPRCRPRRRPLHRVGARAGRYLTSQESS